MTNDRRRKEPKDYDARCSCQQCSYGPKRGSFEKFSHWKSREAARVDLEIAKEEG